MSKREIKQNIEEDKKLFQDKNVVPYIRIYPYRKSKKHLHDREEEGMMTCPSCFRNKSMEDIKYEYCTEYPMLWCFPCGSYAFLDPGSFQKVLDIMHPSFHLFEQYSENSEKYQQMRTEAKCKCDTRCTTCTKTVEEISEEKKPTFCIKVPLLFIERYTSSELSVMFTKTPMTDEDRDFFAQHYSKYDDRLPFGQDDQDDKQDEQDEIFQRCKSIVEKYKIGFIEDQREDEHVMNISIPINDYILNEKRNNFPKYMEIRHDGIYVYAQVRELNGQSKVVSFWGD